MSEKDDEEELAQIVDGLIQRLRNGEAIDWPACLNRHPRHADELRRLAPIMEAMVKVLIEKGIDGEGRCNGSSG